MNLKKELKAYLRILRTNKEEDAFDKFQRGKLSKEKLLEYISDCIIKTLENRIFY